MNINDTAFEKALRERGYRVTVQRQLVFKAMCEASGHSMPDEVYQRVQRHTSAVNRVTVYRTLEFLRDVGLVTSTTAADGHQVYEVVSSEQHHHLICRVCHADIMLPHEQIAPLLQHINDTYAFTLVETLHLTLFGTCAACRE